PDYAFCPVPGIIPETQFPAGGVTVIAEIMRNEQWPSAHAKVQMYRQLDGVEYIFCLKTSPAMDSWPYELYDVGNNNPVYPDGAEQHSFDINETDVPVNDQHLVRFDSRRDLGLPQGALLPADVPDEIAIDLVALAKRARLMARLRGEHVAA
ncbi:hypothetical protein PHYSODRAFT_526597, partial [Phytophthora sojae]